MRHARTTWLNGRLAGMFCILVLLVSLNESCIHDPFIEPVIPDEGNGTPTTPPDCLGDGQVCFESNVLPIFVSACARTGCHNSISRKEGYVLDSYTNIVRKGIVAGKASESKLYKVLFESGEDRMPPDAALTKAQKDSIAAWINQGAKNTTNCNCYCDTTQFTYTAIIQPIMATNCVGCHKTGSLGGNINLSSYAFVKTQVDNGQLLGSVKHATGFTAMPQGGKLPVCEITQIEKWIEAGALNN